MMARTRPVLPSRKASGIGRMILCLGLWAVLACSAGGQSVWELSPYRMRFVVAIAPSPAWRPGIEAELCRDLIARCDTGVGTAWDATAEAAEDDLRRAMLADVGQVAVESLPAPMREADKVTLLVVAPTINGHVVTARSLDVRTQMWAPSVQQPVWQPSKLRDAAYRAAIESFAPIARIEYHKDGGLVLHPRGGGLPTRPDSPTLGRPGQVFLPVVRANDRDGKPRAIKSIPWTFIVVDKAAPANLECTLYSGLRNPLSGRRRGRIEWIALAVTPPEKPSRLTLVSRTDAKRVLSGYDVVSHAPGSKTIVPVGRTDSRGTVIVRPVENPLRLLVVSSGGVPVARLPIVPGLEAELTAAVPNDDDRLEAEGFITALQERLVDLVTRREILLARARSRIAAGKREDARAILDELESLQRQQSSLELQLLEQQKASLSNDPVMQAKIDKLFTDTKLLMAKHLDEEPLEQVARQLRAMGAQP